MEQTGQEVEKLEELLSRCFDDLKARNPHLNESQISKKLGLTRSTFNRIKNVKASGRFDNILKIIIGSGNPECVLEFLKIYDPELAEKMSGALSVASKESDLRWEDGELERLLASPSHFVAYLLSALPNGTDKRQLMEVLGMSGIDSIKALMDKGLVEERAERYFLKDEDKMARSFESIKYHIPTYAKHHRPGDQTPNRGYVHSLSDGLNREGLKALQKSHRKFHQEVSQIYNNENYRGNIPSFSVAFNDTFTKIDNNKEKHQ